MYDEQTPEKLREIIRDTWPQLFWLKEQKQKDKQNDNEYTNNTDEGMV